MKKLVSNTIPGFLTGARKLVLGIRENPFIMERLAPFKITQERMDEYVQVYNNAVNAESTKSKGRGDQYEARDLANRHLRDAFDLASLHLDTVRVALRDDEELFNKIFIGRVPHFNTRAVRIKYILEHYHRIIEAPDVLEKIGSFGIALEDLEAAKQLVLEAQRAKDHHNREMGAAQDYRELRDSTFSELKKVTDFLKSLCKYALKDRPQLMETLGFQVPSPGYKKKKNGTTDTPPTDPPVEDPPVEDPPAEVPPALEPPAEEPPVETPPTETA